MEKYKESTKTILKRIEQKMDFNTIEMVYFSILISYFFLATQLLIQPILNTVYNKIVYISISIVAYSLFVEILSIVKNTYEDKLTAILLGVYGFSVLILGVLSYDLASKNSFSLWSPVIFVPIGIILISLLANKNLKKVQLKYNYLFKNKDCEEFWSFCIKIMVLICIATIFLGIFGLLGFLPSVSINQI